MKYIFSMVVLAVLLFLNSSLQAQNRKIDSTLTIGKTGYHVYCKNKTAEQNELKIRPVGFENTARDMTFYIKGKVVSAAVDDLNNDGFPDLVLFVNTDSSGIYGTVYAMASDQNKAIVPVAMPDLMLDGKLNPGYKGHDEFSLMEGTIMRKFPVYKPGDEKDKPTGGRRAIQYVITGTADTGFKFKILQTYELK
jgi:hypothetical protein